MSETLTNLVYHIVFSSKLRMNTIPSDIEDELYAYIGGIIRGEEGILLKIGGTSNHIHLLTKIHQSKTISEMVKRVKGHTSKWLQSKKSIPFEWQRGYGAFSVSESIVPKVSCYIKNQKEHHSKITFKDELLVLLNKHNIKYNEKYLWN